jgi:hypothetical protein
MHIKICKNILIMQKNKKNGCKGGDEGRGRGGGGQGTKGT